LGCPDLVPGLSLKGWWDREEIAWIAKLEKYAPIIREELLALREQKGFQPYRSPAYANKNQAPDKIGSLGNDSGSWNVFYLYLHDIQFEENCEKVPKTIEILKEVIPRNYFHAFFSALTPGSHITPHNGPTGKKLRVHLPLVGVEGARMRVGDEIK
jgi:aspartate beta-hydroxylase